MSLGERNLDKSKMLKSQNLLYFIPLEIDLHVFANASLEGLRAVADFCASE